MVDFNKFAAPPKMEKEEKVKTTSPRPLSFGNQQKEITGIKKVEPVAAVVKKPSAPGALFKSQSSINADAVSASDLSKYPELKPIEIARLKQISNEINILDYSYALNFGSSVAEKANRKVNKALQVVNQQAQKMLEVKNITDSLKKNILIFSDSQKNFNPNNQAIEKNKSLTSMLKNVFLKGNEEEVKTPEEQVQIIIQITEQFENVIREKIKLFEKTLESISQLIDDSKKNFIEVNILFLAGKEKLEHFEKHEKFRIAEKLESKNISVNQNARDSMDAYNFFKSKLDSYSQMILSGQMTIEQMRLIRNNQVRSISTFQNIFMNLIPSWKQILLSSIATGNFEKFNESNSLLLAALDDIIVI